MDGDVSFEVSLLLNAVAQGEPEAGSKTTWLKERLPLSVQNMCPRMAEIKEGL